MNYRKLKKKWLRATTNEKRYEVVCEWMLYAMREIADGDMNLLKVYKESYTFTDRAILHQDDPRIDWFLDRDFFLMIMTQVLQDMPDLPIKKVFKQFGWDYERSLNPVSGDTSTIEEFQVNDIVHGAQNVRLLLVSKVSYPVGSVVRNIRSGHTYEVGSHEGNRYELIGDTCTLYRYDFDIDKTFEKVA